MSIPQHKDITNYLKQTGEPASYKEIARAFDIKGDARRELRRALRAWVDQGILDIGHNKKYRLPSQLPNTMIIEVTGTSVDGEILAKPAKEVAAPEKLHIEIIPPEQAHPPFFEGDRVLAHLDKKQDGTGYLAEIIRRLDTPQNQVVGTIIKTNKGWELKPSNKKSRFTHIVHKSDLNGAQEGDVVLGEFTPERGRGTPKARIRKIFGHATDTNIISLISLREMGLNEQFPDTVVAETKDMVVPPLGKRTDLRKIPLVTIDGEDARDFDDAVFAEELENGGHHIIVAIADVAYYVRPDTALDEEAYERGNSTYFPDRVVPMLPEKLSNDVCSLRPDEERACMAVHLWIDQHGNLERFKFVRALMKSAARLTYEQVQAALDGTPCEKTAPIKNSIIQPLHNAYKTLWKAREKRGVMDFDMPEKKIIFSKPGEIGEIKDRERLESHKLIEELMILANVAAATALEDKERPAIYRVHDKPDPMKIESLREFSKAFGINVPHGPIHEPRQLANILKQAEKSPYTHLFQQVLLRSQKRAVYSRENIGHFGLALEKYAHFTSPIRRYADLIVHRSLIALYNLGDGALDKGDEAALEEMSLHISQTERTSAEAEWSAIDRFTAKFLSERIGEIFEGQITGLNSAGLFVCLKESGADAFVPMRTLPKDYYIHDERQHALIGRRSGRVYRMGAEIEVRLEEADPLSGNTIASVTDTKGATLEGIKTRGSSSRQNKNNTDSRRKGPRKNGKGGSKSKKKQRSRHRNSKNKGKPKQKK